MTVNMFSINKYAQFTFSKISRKKKTQIIIQKSQTGEMMNNKKRKNIINQMMKLEIIRQKDKNRGKLKRKPEELKNKRTRTRTERRT